MSIYYVGSLAYDSEYLAHHGIKGQKWGIRRFQNPDGSLTPAGKERYSSRYEFSAPNKPNTKSKREMEQFKRIEADILGGEYPDNYKEYSKLQREFTEKFNDATNNKSIGNIPKNEEARRAIKELEKAYEQTRGLTNGASYDKKTNKWVFDEDKRREYKKAWDYYFNVLDDMAGKALKSIGYEDTKEAREFVLEWFQLRT